MSESEDGSDSGNQDNPSLNKDDNSLNDGLSSTSQKTNTKTGKRSISFSSIINRNGGFNSSSSRSMDSSSARGIGGDQSGRTGMRINNSNVDVKKVIESVFLNPVSQSRIISNNNILKASQWSKYFVKREQGKDIKDINETFKKCLIGSFGVAGYEVLMLLYRMHWVS